MLKKSLAILQGPSNPRREGLKRPNSGLSVPSELSINDHQQPAEGFFNTLGGYRNQKPVVPLPPDLVVDLCVGRDRMLAGNQRIGKTDETELLVSIARGLIRAAGRDFEEAEMLGLPVRQRKLETVSAPSFNEVG